MEPVGEMPCPKCQGTGRHSGTFLGMPFDNTCLTCHGTGQVMAYSNVDPSGIRNWNRVDGRLEWRYNKQYPKKYTNSRNEKWDFVRVKPLHRGNVMQFVVQFGYVDDDGDHYVIDSAAYGRQAAIDNAIRYMKQHPNG